jgi:uncharacterized protein YacL
MNQKAFFLREAREVKRHILQYLRHPIEEIKHIPDWSWPRVIGLQVILAGATGALTGLMEKKLLFSVVASLFVSPILTMIPLAIATLFFYYCFQIFAEKTVSLRCLFTLILFANIPQFIFQIVAVYVPAITVIGMAYTAYLLWIGFVANFQIDRKVAMKMIGTLYALFLAFWIWGQVSSSSRWERSWNSERVEAPEVELGK